MRTPLALGALLLLGSTASAAAPTFNKDVAPILHKNCAGCHHEGDVGPFSLVTFADAKKRAKLVATVTGDKVMPPWKPDVGHGDFRQERRLSDRDIQTLAAWAEAGMPEGEPADAPTVPKYSNDWQLGKPDMILKMDEPFPIPADGRDVYHQFVFPLNLTKDVHLRGIEVRPGNRRVAHHAVGILDTSGTAKKLDAKTKGPGYGGLDIGFLPAGFTPGYVPGQTPRFMDEDLSITLKKGTDFVLQMHYHPIGKPQSDQTEVGLYFTKTPPKRGMLVVMMASEEIDIPAGKQGYSATDSFKLTTDFEVRSVWAHMHMIGKTVTVRAELPDGKEKKLLKISDWDFNWQDTYAYREPFVLPKGTTIRADFTWDNTGDNPRNPFSPPRRIRLGEGSADEMSGLILGGASINRWEELGHWGAVIGHYFEIKAKGWKYAR